MTGLSGELDNPGFRPLSLRELVTEGLTEEEVERASDFARAVRPYRIDVV